MITTIAYACILASSYTQLPLSADWSKVERIGVPSYHFVDVERYRFSEPNLKNPNFYPIPTAKVTRDSYMNVLDQMDLANLITNLTEANEVPFYICQYWLNMFKRKTLFGAKSLSPC